MIIFININVFVFCISSLDIHVSEHWFYLYLNSVLDGRISWRHKVQSTTTSCNPKQPGICPQPWYLSLSLSHIHLLSFHNNYTFAIHLNGLLSKLLMQFVSNHAVCLIIKIIKI